jgi:hypothetical protein
MAASRTAHPSGGAQTRSHSRALRERARKVLAQTVRAAGHGLQGREAAPCSPRRGCAGGQLRTPTRPGSLQGVAARDEAGPAWLVGEKSGRAVDVSSPISSNVGIPACGLLEVRGGCRIASSPPDESHARAPHACAPAAGREGFARSCQSAGGAELGACAAAPRSTRRCIAPLEPVLRGAHCLSEHSLRSATRCPQVRDGMRRPLSGGVRR